MENKWPSIEQPRTPEPSGNRQSRVRSLVCNHVLFVTRTLRGSGVPEGDLDDEVQRTFIAAARRIDDIRPEAERGFLFAVATKLAARAGRTRARRREVLNADAAEKIEAPGTPEYVADQKQVCEVFDRVLAGISAPLRAVFVLHAFEELNTRELAAALGIPAGTVASRLRRARSELRARIATVVSAPHHRRYKRQTGITGPNLERADSMTNHG